MFVHFRPCLVLFGLLTLLTGVAYPAFITAIAQTVFYNQANGSVIMRDGKAVGSELIGQTFDDPNYFWGRPSATGPTGYNAAASSGSNLDRRTLRCSTPSRPESKQSAPLIRIRRSQCQSTL
jgi:K+-transporting ATPase ATPase C chain